MLFSRLLHVCPTICNGDSRINCDFVRDEQFLSGGQSEVEATLNLNAMNQSPNPWHVSFSYARALQNTCLKTWGGRPENIKAAQDALLTRAKANSLAQLGKYTGEGESEEAKKGMFVKGYVY
jgi:fructose-bisphosphate aldolase class I